MSKYKWQNCIVWEQKRTVKNLTDKTATSKHPRGSPTLSTPQRQGKRIALRELVNHEMNHVKAHKEPHKEPQVPLRLIPKKLISHAENIYNDSKEK